MPPVSTVAHLDTVDGCPVGYCPFPGVIAPAVWSGITAMSERRENMFLIMINARTVHRSTCKYAVGGATVALSSLLAVKAYVAGIEPEGNGYQPCKTCKPLYAEGWPV